MSRVFTNLKSSQLIVMGTTESSSSTTGCVTLEGGLGVKKAIVAGGWLNTNAGLYVGQSSTLVGPVSCQSNSDSAVQVAGGISCGTNLMVASGIYGSYLTANSLLYNDSNKLIKSATIDTNTLSFSSGSLSLKPNLTLTSLTTWNTRNITKDDTYPVVGDTFKMSLTGNNSLTPYGQVINVSVNSDIRNVSTLTMPSFYNMCLSGYIQPSNSFNITNVYNLFVDGFTCGSYIGVVSNAYSLYVGAPNCGAINQYLAWFQGSSYENHIDARGYVYLNGPLTLNNSLATNINNIKTSSLGLSNGVNTTSLQPSSSLSSTFAINLPVSLPVSNSLLYLDNFGIMSTGLDCNCQRMIASNTITLNNNDPIYISVNNSLTLTANKSSGSFSDTYNFSNTANIKNTGSLTMPTFFNNCNTVYINSSHTGTLVNLYNVYVDYISKTGNYSGQVQNAYNLYVNYPNCGAGNSYTAYFNGSSYQTYIDGVGNLNSSAICTFSNTTDASTYTNASVKMSGGLAVAKQLCVGSNISTWGGIWATTPIYSQSPADSTSTSTGSVVVTGGIGCAKHVYALSHRSWSSGSYTISTTPYNLYTLSSGQSGMIKTIHSSNALSTAYFQWTSGWTSPTIGIWASMTNGGGTISYSFSSSTIQVTVSSGSATAQSEIIFFT